jgi:hypothetical protein
MNKNQESAIQVFMRSLVEAIQMLQLRHFGKKSEIFVMFLEDDSPYSYASTDACPVKVVDHLQRAIRSTLKKMSEDKFKICDDCPGLHDEK